MMNIRMNVCSDMPAWRTKQELNIMQEVDVSMSVMNIG